ARWRHRAGTTGTVCRAVAGAGDLEETCDGTSPACPLDTFQPSSVECRPAAGACDAAETCTGASATCPPDAPQPNGAVCDDGNFCTGNHACPDGTRVGAPT